LLSALDLNNGFAGEIVRLCRILMLAKERDAQKTGASIFKKYAEGGSPVTNECLEESMTQLHGSSASLS
jgi:hypothetical protein